MHPTLGPSTLLDRAAHLRGDNRTLQQLRTHPDARHLLLFDGRPAILSDPARISARIRWLTADDLGQCGIDTSAAIFLGLDRTSGAGRFAVALAGPLSESLTNAFAPVVDLRSLATQGAMAREEIALLGNAKSLADWHARHGFCPSCGARSEPADGGWRRSCAPCGYAAYPRVDPVVIMLLTDGERIVVTREPRFPEHMVSLPAGYVEPGEDVEHAVRRETKEELGLDVGDVSYQLSQPWPFPHSLMIGCIGHVPSAQLVPDPAEIEAARWAAPEDIRAMLGGTHPEGLWLPGDQAIANALVRRWLAGHASKT